MDNNGQQSYLQGKPILDPYQQQQLDSWKNRVHKFFLDALPYVYRAINEILLILMKTIRGSFRIMKEQLFKN